MRREDSFARSLVVEQDSAVALLVSVWPMVPLRRRPDPPSVPSLAVASFQELWAWTWTCVDIPLAAVQAMTGFSQDRAERVVEQARLSGLVYPDGTVSKFAKTFIEARIRNTIPRPKTANQPPASPTASSVVGAAIPAIPVTPAPGTQTQATGRGNVQEES